MTRREPTAGRARNEDEAQVHRAERAGSRLLLAHRSVPDDRLIVIVLGNLEDAAVNTLADDLAAIALEKIRRCRNRRTKMAAADRPSRRVCPERTKSIRSSCWMFAAEDSKLYLRGTAETIYRSSRPAKSTFFYRQLYVKSDGSA